MEAVSIRILAKDNNRRGDLFGRLMGDLFLSLGYDDVRLNIARSGREIDIEAKHRLEKRLAMAECKALREKAGGKEINAFAGKLRPERRKRPGVPITPYFISLSGFTETSVDQEDEAGDEAIILVDGQRIVAELIKGRILVPYEKAAEKAGQCVAGQKGLTLDEHSELLAHDCGWVWAVYYTQGRQRTHVALIHSDGTPLAASVAQEIITADRSVRGSLYKIVCLHPEPAVVSDTTEQIAVALAQYHQYLAAECGYILLDGLPADAEAGSRRLRLENLFVPLHLTTAQSDESTHAGISATETATAPSGKRQPVGEVLAESPRVAILASPGGGKSTLLKRIAVAYADPDRRQLANDHLPERVWLPLFFRCRELRDRARAPFVELVDALAERAGLGDRTRAFRAHVDRALRNGEVLLLVDGLDEISDPGDRMAFVRHLRTFLAIYPNVSLVVTSREAGFRHVAGLLATVCRHTRLADFNADDIRRLSVAWHREVVGDRPDAIADAEALAVTIVANDRIRQLAVNPLLLTTLLLVKRWVGQLPTRRSVLYGKAVEVLLMTWNVEGHEPIEQDEALPQLCYIAYTMMQSGEQKISRPDLTRLLREAREQLAAELAYARIGIAEFIERVEHRSSLLMMTGHDVVNGTLTEFYEFRHLTFQEYLTAKAIVEGWYPRRKESDALVFLLEPYFEAEKWREVIPLAAVLGGRKADALVKRLTERFVECSAQTDTIHLAENPILFALGNCLADEAQVTPDTLRQAIRELVCRGRVWQMAPFTPYLARGKYGDVFRDEAGKRFLTGGPDLTNSGISLMTSVFYQLVSDDSEASLETALNQLKKYLMSTEILRCCEGALGITYAAFRLARQDRTRGTTCRDLLNTCADALVPMLFSESTTEQFAACWAFVWIGTCRVWTPPNSPNVLDRVFTFWLLSPDMNLGVISALALAMLPLLPRESEPLRASLAIDGFISKVKQYDQMDYRERLASVVAAYYLRSPWHDMEITRRAREFSKDPIVAPTLREIIAILEAEGTTTSPKPQASGTRRQRRARERS